MGTSLVGGDSCPTSLVMPNRLPIGIVHPRKAAQVACCNTMVHGPTPVFFSTTKNNQRCFMDACKYVSSIVYERITHSQTLQDTGQWCSMYLGFLSHSRSSAQVSHFSCLSLHSGSAALVLTPSAMHVPFSATLHVWSLVAVSLDTADEQQLNANKRQMETRTSRRCPVVVDTFIIVGSCCCCCCSSCCCLRW